MPDPEVGSVLWASAAPGRCCPATAANSANIVLLEVIFSLVWMNRSRIYRKCELLSFALLHVSIDIYKWHPTVI